MGLALLGWFATSLGAAVMGFRVFVNNRRPQWQWDLGMCAFLTGATTLVWWCWEAYAVITRHVS